jgi:hypothetical protein
MARVHGQLVAVLDRAAHLVDVGEVDTGIDALAEQVQREGDEADVAGALAVAEQAALYPVGTGLYAELGRGNRGATVVVRVQGEDDAVATGDVAVEPLDLVGVDVRRRHLHGRRQVQHDLVLRRRLPDVHHRVADLDGVVELGAGEGLRAVLEPHRRLRPQQRLGVLHAPLGTTNGNVLDAVLVQPEHHAALQR